MSGQDAPVINLQRARALKALEGANKNRVARVAIKREISSAPYSQNSRMIAARYVALCHSDPIVGSFPVAELLLSIRSVGEQKVKTIMSHAGIKSGNKRMRDLTERQRGALALALRNYHLFLGRR